MRACVGAAVNSRACDSRTCLCVAQIALVAMLALIGVTGPAIADKRVALVIGNSAYQNVARLDNPRNDAVLMGRWFRAAGSSAPNRMRLTSAARLASPVASKSCRIIGAACADGSGRIIAGKN
jgi:hypothetical protein